MDASIIIIGDEMLLGQVTDTNSGAIARMLGPNGWRIKSVEVVSDDAAVIKAAVTRAMADSRLVITTGGLGPTKDDVTKHVLTDYFGGHLVFDQSVSDNIDKVFAKRGLKVNDYTRAQAMVPTSCRVIQNELGTAPIMWFERDGHVLISMPGVPFETVGMMERSVLRNINEHFGISDCRRHRTFIVNGITESGLAQQLSGWEEALPSALHLAYLPMTGYLRLRLDGVTDDPDVFEDYCLQLKSQLGELLLYEGDATPAQILLERLRAKGYTVSSAESCTGGNIAHHITEMPGSSENYMGTVVSYSNEVKARVLGVSTDDLERCGAVSEPVVRQMAEGAVRVIGTDCSVATSGIAGPGGGSPDKPVGTVWMAAHVPGRTETRCKRFPGDRGRVIDRATTEALLMLIRLLDDSPKGE